MCDRVFISGIGVASPNVIGKNEYWESCRNGISGIKEIFTIPERLEKLTSKIQAHRKKRNAINWNVQFEIWKKNIIAKYITFLQSHFNPGKYQ